MEAIRGKTSYTLDFPGFKNHLTNYTRILLDLGTGDGRYVRFLADRNPHCFFIGLDSCRENLREHSRLKSANALFVIAGAQELPREFNGLISHITINFPWGSLLKSLLEGEAALMDGLRSIAKQSAQIEILLNSGALLEAGADLNAGARRIYENLTQHGWNVKHPTSLSDRELRNIPTTWAKRLAYGRDPRAIALSGRFDA